MSRYPNPYRRRGWRRNEPVPLYVVPPNDPLGAVFAVLSGLYRAGWRYRSELAPFAVAGAVAWAGWRLHATAPGAWPVLAVLTLTLALARASSPISTWSSVLTVSPVTA